MRADGTQGLVFIGSQGQSLNPTGTLRRIFEGPRHTESCEVLLKALVPRGGIGTLREIRPCTAAHGFRRWYCDLSRGTPMKVSSTLLVKKGGPFIDKKTVELSTTPVNSPTLPIAPCRHSFRHSRKLGTQGEPETHCSAIKKGPSSPNGSFG